MATPSSNDTAGFQPSAPPILLMSAQVLRRYPGNKLAKQWIHEGRIGRVASVQRRRMGNSIRNLEGYAWAKTSYTSA